MDTVKYIREKAKSKLKTIVLPEYNEKRIVEAAGIIEKEGIAKVLLLTPEGIDPKDKQRYIEEYYQIHKHKDLEMDTVKELFTGTLYYAAMMTREGRADGIVGGAYFTTREMARATIRCLGVDERITIASSSFIMVLPDSSYGENGTFVFADCGIIPEPNSRQLACICLATSELAKKVLNLTPRIALLSYSTRGSASGKAVEKITEALELVKEMAPELLVDGELQVDAAIVPEVA
ncbi:MAG: phosphate acyltransferase, partial [Candidatus Omnitrophota bacterium]|nr:phosphate acyltransferase [Candidatus Omnitrophota bacterium]